MRSHVFSFVLLFLLVSLTAQSKDPVLMTINGNPVTKSEFEYIYNKNNSNNSLDKKTLSEYVDLFVNFKLKVQEAKAQGLDTTSAFVNELSGYRSQLTKPYLTDQNVDEQILREAYNRMQEDVEVSHILIRVAQNASAADTLTAWKKITSIAKRLEKEDFKKVAKETSEDPSAEKNGGYIGWISAFHTVYPFETTAYNTPVGNISKPFRTAFGYHILKVQNRRNSLGEILVAHIMRFTTEGNDDKNKDAKIKIDSLYKRVQAGDDFGKLASEYSEDRGSASRNGELPWFGTGRMIPEFENAAFALQNTGDVSAPVKSGYGWHIIKLLDRKPIGTYESLKPELERRIKQDERAGLSQKVFVEKLKKEYNFSLNTESVQEFVKLLGTKNLSDSAFRSQISVLNKTLFTFAGKTYLQNNFSDYLAKNNLTDRNSAQEIIDEKLNAFAERELLAYEDSQLENKYEDFRFLMQEYHDGILLFEVSNNEVWEKASKDTKGLENYFNTHKTDYTWEKPHYKGKIIYCKDKATYNAAKTIIRKLNTDSIEKYLPLRLNDSIQHVKIEKGLYAQGDNKAIDKYGFKVKNAVYEPSAEYPYIIVVGKNLKNSPENYTDVRGLVTADYQDYLEKTWIAALRAKYPVVIDQTVLKTIKQN
ncbi:MAG: PpiC-type peptidyl-prolyl cis-trans isomerase [Bacteroidetes bacterium]|nr:PpiC-type peptidyl-prolyl cis-trans isomerase [Bacteroidota bacterium]